MPILGSVKQAAEHLKRFHDALDLMRFHLIC